MDASDRRLRIGVVDQKLRVYTAADNSAFVDLSIEEGLDFLGVLGSNLKRAIGAADAALPPSHPQSHKLRYTAASLVTATLPDGQPVLAFSFQNFPNLVIPVPVDALAKAAKDMGELANLPPDVRSQSNN